MSEIILKIDTESQTMLAEIDGKSVEGDICSFSAYLFSDYYSSSKKKKVSWNISLENDTENDDFRSTTNYCSASEIKVIGEREFAKAHESKTKKVQGQIADFFSKK